MVFAAPPICNGQPAGSLPYVLHIGKDKFAKLLLRGESTGGAVADPNRDADPGPDQHYHPDTNPYPCSPEGRAVSIDGWTQRIREGHQEGAPQIRCRCCGVHLRDVIW